MVLYWFFGQCYSICHRVCQDISGACNQCEMVSFAHLTQSATEEAANPFFPAFGHWKKNNTWIIVNTCNRLSAVKFVLRKSLKFGFLMAVQVHGFPPWSFLNAWGSLSCYLYFHIFLKRSFCILCFFCLFVFFIKPHRYLVVHLYFPMFW